MKRLRNCTALLIFLFVFTLPALADENKKLMVLPFAINGPQSYQYLEKSIPQMFSTRLHWPGHIDALLPESAKLNQVPANESAVRSILDENALDYVVWGSITVIGENCSLDVRVLDKDGKIWTKSRENRVDQLIPVLSSVSDSVNTEVLRREAQPATASTRQTGPVTPVSIRATETHSAAVAAATGAAGGIIMAEESNSGALQMMENKDDDRYISQQVNISALGMAICDADGDGRLEVFLFDDHYLSVFHYENGRLVSLGKNLISRTLYNVALSYYDFGPGKGVKLFLTSVDMDRQPKSRVLSFKDRRLVTEDSSLDYFLNVVQQPDGSKKILGQRGDHYDMFRPNGIYEMSLVNGKLVSGKSVSLLPRLNIYSFAYLPGKKGTNDPTRVVQISPLEKAQVYSMSGTKLFESKDDYSGSSAAIEINETMVGFGDSSTSKTNYYYLPMNMPVADLDGDGRYEIIMNKPISMLGQFIESYRAFVECEVYCMFWDGMGLSPQWKTPLLSGSVAGTAICDLDGDGVLDLVVCLNTAGSTVLHDQKSTIVGFPLKYAKTSTR